MANNLNAIDLYESLGQSTIKTALKFLETAALPPTVGNFYPASGVVSPTGEVGFDITTLSGNIATVIVYVIYPTLGESDVIYQDIYLPGYSGSVVSISGGLQFRFKRTLGFNAPFNLYVQSVGTNGAGN
jgi:hypothetical protein